jgi:hypothetical protein
MSYRDMRSLHNGRGPSPPPTRHARCFAGCFALLALLSGGARADCPYGEDQCLPGYVWRDAFPGDRVCVPGQSRAQAASDNALDVSRKSRGSNLCLQGFVWREADPIDYVCVTVPTRSQAALENQQAAQHRDPTCNVARTPQSLGVLALNVGGIGNGEANVPWETRAKRLAASLRRNRLTPEIVTVAEVHGWMATPIIRSCGRGLGVNVGDYDQIDILLSELKAALGINYRVAYMTGDVGSFGAVECKVFYAQAMLYDPAKVTHLVPPLDGALRHDGHSSLVGQPHLRLSLPMCSRGTRLMPLETLIDGPPVVQKCHSPTPSGPAYTVFGSNFGHVSGSYARFAFVSDPSQTIDVFNMHLNAHQEWEDLPGIMRLINDHTPPPYIGTSSSYPPIMSGDFNLFAGLVEFPLFSRAGTIPGDVMAIGMGLHDKFPSKFRARVAQTVQLPDRPDGVSCGDPRFMFSDHCGLFIRFDRDLPQADALRGVFIDGPAKVTSGDVFEITLTPSGGSPDLSFLWSPGGVSTQVLRAVGGAADQTQKFTATVMDRRSGISQSASHDVHYVAPASAAQCKAACDARRDACMAEVPKSDGPSPAQCVQQHRECLQTCSVP